MGTIDGRKNLIDDQDDEPRTMLSFTAHEHDGEFVIRLHHENGFISLGVANGQEEADLIVRSLNSVCSDWASSARGIKEDWERYVR